jgi:hypothetical protein
LPGDTSLLKAGAAAVVKAFIGDFVQGTALNHHGSVLLRLADVQGA